MAVQTTIESLSQTAASNGPDGSDPPSSLDDALRYHGGFIAQLRDGKGYAAEVDVASASTCDIGAANSLLVRITGTTTIVSFGTNYKGPRFIRFGGALTLTHNAASLILPGGVNIVTAAGDTCLAVPVSGGWAVANYQRAGGLAMLANGPAFRARRTSSQGGIVSGVDTKVQLPFEDFDSANAFDSTSTYRFTPQVAGYYQINGAVYIAASVGATTVSSKIYRNGVEYASSFHTVPSTGDHKLAVSDIVLMNGTTDYVELYGLAVGSGITFSNGSFLSGALIRPF